jgi:hypothetical protein
VHCFWEEGLIRSRSCEHELLLLLLLPLLSECVELTTTFSPSRNYADKLLPRLVSRHLGNGLMEIRLHFTMEIRLHFPIFVQRGFILLTVVVSVGLGLLLPACVTIASGRSIREKEVVSSSLTGLFTLRERKSN